MFRLLLIGVLVMAIGLPLAFGAAGQKNVVVIVTDDQGLDAGCYGNKVIQTPNMDQLAAEGTLFEYAFCTTSSCSASRSVILTGLYNHANGQYGHMHGVHNLQSFKWVRSLPLLLADAGYRTCSIGKHHVQPEANYHFETYANEGLVGGPRSAVQMAENAERFIRQKDDRPFFVYFCPTDPHRSGTHGGFANHRDYPGVKKVVYDPETIPVPSYLPDEPEVRRELAEYYQAISRADQGTGRLMQALKDTGHWDDTLIIYLGDNGAPFPGAKTTLYEPGMHLPFVVRSPEQKTRGGKCDALVTFADITPTILDWAGAKGPKYELQGRSFLSVLDTPSPAGWDEIYASHTFHGILEFYPMRVIRTRQYKYILNLAHPLTYPSASDLFASETWQGVLKRGDKMYGRRTVEAYLHRPRHELYDLQADPDEVVNLAGKPEHAELLNTLQSKLRTWQEQTKDPWISKYEHE